MAAQRWYDAWGNRRASSGGAPGNYQFTGAELDPTSGLYHMGARFYDPTIGRWLSEDPVQDKHFDPATLNFYAYVYANPLSYVDHDGSVAFLAVLAVGWIATELGLTAYDIFSAARTIRSNASTGEKILAVGLAVAGVIGPGGGGSALLQGAKALIARGIISAVDNRVFMKVGSKAFEFTSHALQRAGQRGISLGAVHKAMAQGKSFQYSHGGILKTGYYDPSSGVFVATLGDEILTVFITSEDYIKRLIQGAQ